MNMTKQLILPLAVLMTLGLSTSANGEVKSSSEEGFHIEIIQQTDVAADVAYHHFTRNIGGWWLDSHTWFGDSQYLSIDTRAGGCFCELNGEQQAEHLMVAYVDPGQQLILTGGLGPLKWQGLDGALTIRFEANQLKLTYIADGYPTIDMQEFAPLVDNVLLQQTSAFKSYLESLQNN